MDTALISKSSSGSVYAHSRRLTSSLTLPHQPSRLPRHDQHEISGSPSRKSLQSELLIPMHWEYGPFRQD
ncbi:MAG: hypothetical protein K9M81_04320 [Chthoniobacterales bacterium]|nr:hypothetical protein [Chthoniobacterales bacterium]